MMQLIKSKLIKLESALEAYHQRTGEQITIWSRNQRAVKPSIYEYTIVDVAFWIESVDKNQYSPAWWVRVMEIANLMWREVNL